MVRWIFFDIGNVLLIDEPLVALNWEEIYQALNDSGRHVTFTELMTQREQVVQQDQDAAPHMSIGIKLLGQEGWAEVKKRIKAKVRQDYLHYNFVRMGAAEVMANLSTRYKLAVAANQPKDVFRKAMEDAGLLGFFDILGISDEMGLSKPDPRFFQLLLSQAGCTASEAIMIGDRIDNDIVPAQKLGMHTIWFNLSPEAQGYVARSSLEQLYIDSLHRAPSRGTGHPNQQIEPSVTVTSLDQLLAAIESIADGPQETSNQGAASLHR